MSTVRSRSLASLLDASSHEDDETTPLSDVNTFPSSSHSIQQLQRQGRFVLACRTSSSCYGLFPLRNDCEVVLALILAIFAVGSTLGFVLPTSDELHGAYRRVSAVIGWTYFCSWSISFYPQVLLNYQRKTSVGVSFDFLMYNVLAFSCYAAFTCSLFWSWTVQASYDKRHAGKPNKVQLNDAVFALHAVFVSSVTLGQALYYDWRAGRQRPSCTAIVFCAGVAISAGLYASVVAIEQALGVGEEQYLTWLDFLYFLSYVKVGTSILKYIPQVVLNARRRSTQGWTIWNVILDLIGGLLSVLQLMLDCWNTGDWSGIRGYPVKFAIGLVSVVFDLVFMLQHYVLYRRPSAALREQKEGTLCTMGAAPSTTPLLQQDPNAQGPGHARMGDLAL